jgi:hypothetical protein
MNLRFFKSNADLLRKHDIQIVYYFNPGLSNSKELENYIDKDIVTLKPINELQIPTNPDTTIELWMGNNIDNLTHREFEKYYESFYNNIYKYIYIDKIIDSMWLDEPYLLTHHDTLDTKFKNLDIFILNNIATHNRFDPYNELNEIAIKLSKKYKVATICKVSDDIPSTLDSGLSLYDIGAIGTHAKDIISIVSGPITTLFNAATKNHVQKWFAIHTYGVNFDFYSTNNTLINTNNLDPIYEYYCLDKS